jgi:Ca2+-binding EF-hand superfamily protein
LISQEELIQGIDKFSNLGASNLTQEDGKRLFEAIDIDFSGEIDYTEFIASFMGLKLKNDKKYLR